MKKSLIALIFLLSFASLPAQKKMLGFMTYDWWPKVEAEKISNDGKFLTYNINSKKAGSRLIIQSIDNTWKKEIQSGSDAIITEDSKKVIYLISSDTLAIFDIETQKLQLIPQVKQFKIHQNGNFLWLAYHLNLESKSLILHDLLTGKDNVFDSVADYYFNEPGNTLLLQTFSKIDTNATHKLILISLPDLKSDTILQNCRAGDFFAFDQSGTQISFIDESTNTGPKKNSLKYFKLGMDSAISLVTEKTAGMDDDSNSVSYNPVGTPFFSKDGSQIFFHVKRLSTPKSIKSGETEQVNIWNYKDEKLKSEQLKSVAFEENRTFLAVVNAYSKTNVIRLQSSHDSDIVKFSEKDKGKYILVCSRNGNSSENYWRSSSRFSYYLESTIDGTRKLIKKNMAGEPYQLNFSPSGKYLIWFDAEERHFFTYNRLTGVVKNISKKVPVKLYDDENDTPLPPNSFDVAGWLVADTSVLLYDRYDIWRVDPEGIRMPINLTGGYGRKNKMVLRFLNTTSGTLDSLFSLNSKEILLSAFSRIDKTTGFLRMKLGNPNVIELLSIGPFFPADPIKAKFRNIYTLKRENASSYPNLFSTTDFRRFTQLTKLSPQEEFNWYTSELVIWDAKDFKHRAGVLYKPENFDSSKKYPLIFHFYEKYSDYLNNFLFPGLSPGEINIPWFVSNGYLVFVPDIYYKVGYPGESAFNAVFSAAKYFSKKPWVDTKRMGLQGHSFGGYETNYIITRTNLFAAACSAAGPADLINLTFNLRPGTGESAEYVSENGQTRVGATLWQKRDLYIKNSPIFFADKVSTPLLLMHNENDEAVPWVQSIEWFSALRRLGKKVWMLQYIHGDHALENESDQLDYSIRLSQFFDHFLKAKPAPTWMTEATISDSRSNKND